jgi:hypothetical protein
MIAHLFGKVYMSFDTTLRPVYDTLIVSSGIFAVSESFINNHVGYGSTHGNFKDTSEVDWPTFFNSVNDRRTVIYADANNFGKIYFSFLKTINPTITFENAKNILNIILKRAEFYIVQYPAFGFNQGEAAREDIKTLINQVESNYQESWLDSSPWELTESFIQDNLGLEYIIAKYWIDGSNEELLKEKLESIWWKNFISWGEEATRLHSQKWVFVNTDPDLRLFNSTLAADENLFWMVDPDLNLDQASTFRQKHDWTVIEKIWNYIKDDQTFGLIIELKQHWQVVVDKDWDKILDKNTPMPILALATEPVYRLLVNSWLISYFANQPTEKLREFIL